MDSSQWARSVEERLDKLDRQTVARIGAWTLSEDSNGDLVADNANGARRVIARRL